MGREELQQGRIDRKVIKQGRMEREELGQGRVDREESKLREDRQEGAIAKKGWT